MPVFMLDTNICIYIHKHKPPEVRARFAALPGGSAVMSAITWGELMYGAQKSVSRVRSIEAFEEFRMNVPVAPLSDAVGPAYGKLRAQLQANGNLIGPNDLWIAAHALSGDFVLATNNEREFSRIEGLKVENWTRR